MHKMTKQEMHEMEDDGAEFEIEPQHLIVEGLIEQLKALTPDHSQMIAELRRLTDAISNMPSHDTLVECNPQIDCAAPVTNNKIMVDTTPISQALERMMHRPDYRFTVVRNNRGLIESMTAEVIDK